MLNVSVLLSSFVLIFLAEIGDKTQLMAMTLAHRYRTGPVVAGVFLAFLLLNALAVTLGSLLSTVLPRNLILVTAGMLFLYFAYRSWRDAGEDEEADEESSSRDAFIASFTLIFIAELGDKTQLAMIAIAAQTSALWSVFIGGTLALWSVSLLGIIVGASLLRRIPQVWVHRGAALLFLSFGLFAFYEAASLFPG